MLKWGFMRIMMADGDAGGSGGGEGAGDSEAGKGKGDTGAGKGDADTILGSGDGDGAGAGKGEGKGAGEGDKGAGKGEGDGKWSWGENVPGTGTVPPWLKTDKFKTVADQARGFTELETKIGPAAELIGAPDGDYKMPALPEGVEGEWDLDDAMLKTFQTTAKEMSLSQVAYDKVVQAIGSLLANETTAEEKKVSDALSELGTNVPERINQVKTYLTTMLGEDGYKTLRDAIGTDVQAYISLEALVAKASGDARLSLLPGQGGLGFTKADIEAERYKVYADGHALAGKIIYEHDDEHRAKVKGMYKELFPGEDHQTVGK